MIENEQQYARTKTWADKFAAAALDAQNTPAPTGVDPILHKAMIDGMLSQRESLLEQMADYDGRRFKSRNQREGRYVGSCAGKEVRRHEVMSPLEVANEIIIPEYRPYVDSSIAILTTRERNRDRGVTTTRSRKQRRRRFTYRMLT
jgi:hypothetical protein